MILTIANDDSLIGELFDIMIRQKDGFRSIIVRGDSRYIDDYSLSELGRFDAVVYYNYTYRNREKALTLLRDFEKSGGTAINFTLQNQEQVEQIISLPKRERSSVSYQIRGDETVINVSNGSPNTPILVKFSYFPRWEASYGDKSVKIYRVSPEFMFIFLEEMGNKVVKLVFIWGQENYGGALISIITLGLCAVLLPGKRLGKFKTRIAFDIKKAE